MRIAFIQMKVLFGDKKTNMNHARGLLANCQARLCVLPELCITGYCYTSRREVEDLAEPIPSGPTCYEFSTLARRSNCYLVFGMAEKAGDKIYNSAVLIGPNGHLATYRKIHLYNEEKEWFDPGDLPFRVAEIDGAKIGMMICFDWIFPESVRSLALQGAEIICHPANLVLPYCQRAMVTRCLENGVFAITANRIGTEQRHGKKLHFTGGSQITGPRGEIFSRAPKIREMVGIVEIDPAVARDKWLNDRNHLLQDRRLEKYSGL